MLRIKLWKWKDMEHIIDSEDPDLLSTIFDVRRLNTEDIELIYDFL